MVYLLNVLRYLRQRILLPNVIDTFAMHIQYDFIYNSHIFQ